MRMRRRKIDMATIAWDNQRHKDHIEHYRKMLYKADNDPDRKARLEKSECIFCYGGSRIGGAAMTRAQCAFCDRILNSGNTAIDVCCIDCAKVANICKHCGCDIDFKNARKRNLPERTPDIAE